MAYLRINIVKWSSQIGMNHRSRHLRIVRYQSSEAVGNLLRNYCQCVSNRSDLDRTQLC